ncbi:MAG: 16S rRNA (uracil(1498)-N(3))-methyltransferase [Xanthomonadaceae bacterium]|jgi:16S rRNA (uracil1498-N3)-methyltransferase|nr:16S rRNA (uracil(1498)-N(3))-methyltransferase [Xanthomonadaceae bacterium]
MRLTRCYVELPLRKGATVDLPEPVVRHLAQVMRMRSGDECVLFNGDGHDYRARLLEADKRSGSADILDSEAVDNESSLRITLLQGIARGEKMDLILQKATELGVVAFVPVMAERTEVKLDAARSGKRLAHWRNVIESACGQSGRARVPSLTTPAPLAVALSSLDIPIGTRLTLDPMGEHRLTQLALSSAELVIATGPEGGWSPHDRATLADHGFSGLQLGPRILRTETAGLAAIAALQSRFGDM